MVADKGAESRPANRRRFNSTELIIYCPTAQTIPTIPLDVVAASTTGP